MKNLRLSLKILGSFATVSLITLVIGLVGWLNVSRVSKHLNDVSFTHLPSIQALIRLNDTSFSVTDNCTSCGVCVKVCPVNNIIMAGDRPTWQHRCENCIACYNFCPEKAIRNGIASEGYFYRHPDIKIKDMMIREG